jgi:alpha-N-acetylglucosamine transferase
LIKLLYFYKILNDKYIDFGKWKYALTKHYNEIMTYDNIIFMNDSFLLTNNIDNYFNNLIKYDFYGFTSNNEIKYHYQSYLFALKNL